MPPMPILTVQLVHIQGPLKGQVSEFSQFPVHIGRHSSCQIRFGKDMATISRQHARIECKGNRFRIIDVSTNGTFINGKRIADVYLRDGDVITFSENGPKASFLTKIGAGSTNSSTIPASRSKPTSSRNASNQTDRSLPPSPDPNLTVGADLEIEVLSANAPLVIQFGQTLQSYNLLPITIGNDPACDFVIADDKLNDRHVQIFFSEKEYYAKDLTGKGIVTINGRPIETQSVLAQGAELSLADQGPIFRFLGEGRLAEIQAVKPDPQEKLESGDDQLYESKKKKSLFRKFFK
jgi:pSer/pThr/pTyr-binding forkhead associated (FHA) protein